MPTTKLAEFKSKQPVLILDVCRVCQKTVRAVVVQYDPQGHSDLVQTKELPEDWDAVKQSVQSKLDRHNVPDVHLVRPWKCKDCKD